MNGQLGRSTIIHFLYISKASEDVLTWLADNTAEDDYISLLTDSCSPVSKLQRGTQVTRPCYKIMYECPRHVGVIFNERANEQASSVTAFGDLDPTAKNICILMNKGKNSLHTALAQREGCRKGDSEQERRSLRPSSSGVRADKQLRTSNSDPEED